MSGPEVVVIEDGKLKKKRPLGRASEALADAASNMDKSRDASWDWVRAAMAPRPAAPPATWMGRPMSWY